MSGCLMQIFFLDANTKVGRELLKKENNASSI